MSEEIEVYGIETNNLKNIDVTLKKNAINLILGPSGSGKSSLAYDTIAQIGQYEYMSMFADNFMEPKYKVKGYHNMIAAVPIRQTNFNNNMRSTIGTYFGLNRSLGFIYSVITGASEDEFVLNKEANLCEKCHGLGTIKRLDPNKIINWDIPLKKVPMRCWNRYKDFYSQMLDKYCSDKGIDASKNFRQLNDIERDLILNGSSEYKYTVRYKKTNRLSSRTARYEGVLTNEPMLPGFNISSQYYSDYECDCCHGKKYSEHSEAYKVENVSIGQAMTMPFSELVLFVNKLISKYGDSRLGFSLNKIKSFADMALSNNLGHLFLHRAIPTLSGGELQRLRLVQVFNTQLSGLMIILDEPLAGLSSVEKHSVYQNIIKLSHNHTVVLVDHGDTFLKDAKQIYALGPKGGAQGGKLINVKRFLEQQKKIPEIMIGKVNTLSKVELFADVYTYKGVDIKIADHSMNLIYGRSGIGKSTLLREYFPQFFEKYIYINQKPLVGSSTSSVATLLDIFTRLTELLAKKYNKDRRFFSNQTGCDGACPTCGGTGFLEYSIGNGNTTRIECKDCDGTGFNRILEKYKLDSKNIFDIWNMTIDDAENFFADKDKIISEKLKNASDIMLGHLRIGQPTSTLSGGENIRIKILKQNKTTAEVLGIDEPFKGLSNTEIFAVASFLMGLQKLGKTIIVVDHTEEAKKYFAKLIELDVRDGILVDKRA